MEGWHFWFAGRTALLRRLLSQYLHPRGQWLLDVGCGTGRTLDLLSELGYVPVGLDRLREGLVARRRQWPEARLMQAEADALPVASGAVDGAVLLDVLEHVDDRCLLQELKRIVRPGGRVVLTVPAMPWLWSVRDAAAGHRRRYARAELGRVLEAAGFRVETLVYYQFFLFPLIAIARLLGRNSEEASRAEETPPGLLNRLLTAVNLLEVRLGRHVSWPWGSSLAAVCTLEGPTP